MHKFVSGMLAVTLIGGAGMARPLAAQQGSQRFGFVNSQLILKQTPGFAQAESTFTQEVEAFRTEVAKLQATLDSASAAFNRDAVLLSPTAREAKRKELETQQSTLEARIQELRDKASQRETELLDPITTRIQQVIDGLRAEGNYAMIFDIAVLQNGIISADKALDLTATVIQRLQANR